MTVTVTAVYDGAVFRPSEPVALQPGAECTLTIEAASRNGDSPGEKPPPKYALSAIAAMAVDMGVTDLADRHHEYAHPVVKEE
jgi:hypothetical protein